jgi:hypothetical protein
LKDSPPPSGVRGTVAKGATPRLSQLEGKGVPKLDGNEI